MRSATIAKSIPAMMLCGGLLVAACVTGPTPKEIRQAEIEYDLGINNLRNGMVAEALKNFLDAVEVHPDFAEAQHALGLAYHILGEYERAQAHYQRALELKPGYSEVLNNMGRLYISQDKFRLAIPLLRKALDDVFLKERYLAEGNLGWALFHAGEEEAGMKRVRNALAQNQDFCVGYEYMGMMYQTRKQTNDAIREFEELVKRCPKYASGHRNLGKALLMAGKIEKGCKELDLCRAGSRMTDVGAECDRLFRKSCTDASGAQPRGSGG